MADPRHVIATLTAALNARDLEAFVACFYPDYTSDQPGFPERTIHSRDKVRENWQRIFAQNPDLEATLLDLVIEGMRVSSGWRLASQTRRVTVYGKIDFELGADGRIITGRLYMPDLPQLGIWRAEAAAGEGPAPTHREVTP